MNRLDRMLLITLAQQAIALSEEVAVGTAAAGSIDISNNPEDDADIRRHRIYVQVSREADTYSITMEVADVPDIAVAA